jgi:uracil-DNA glycosylase
VPSLVPGSTADLPALAAFLEGCPRCKLSGSRTRIVFGYGNPTADLMFVGEAPGREEDEQGLPFVGAAGQLLTKIIEAMGTTRDQVYIVNTVKCRPPNNRNPEPDEIAACRPFFEEQIRLVSPRVIVTLGTSAAQAVLGSQEPISQLRGRWHDAYGARIMPTFHPAFLLRSPKHKRDVWEDMQKVRDFLAD